MPCIVVSAGSLFFRLLPNGPRMEKVPPQLIISFGAWSASPAVLDVSGRQLPAQPLSGLVQKTQESSAALRGDVTSRDLVFVSSERCQDFGLLALRNLEVSQGPPELRCDLIEFCR